jgi:hypothetical protein
MRSRGIEVYISNWFLDNKIGFASINHYRFLTVGLKYFIEIDNSNDSYFTIEEFAQVIDKNIPYARKVLNSIKDEVKFLKIKEEDNKINKIFESVTYDKNTIYLRWNKDVLRHFSSFREFLDILGN